LWSQTTRMVVEFTIYLQYNIIDRRKSMTVIIVAADKINITLDFRLCRLWWNHNILKTTSPKQENYNTNHSNNHEQLERIIILYLTFQILGWLNYKSVFFVDFCIKYYIVSCTSISHVLLLPSLKFPTLFVFFLVVFTQYGNETRGL